MKKNLVGLVFIFFSGVVFSAPVPIETAKKIAENWYFERDKVDKKAVAMENCFAELNGMDTLFYVFNISSGGFVIVSAEDIVVPVIGYAFKGHYTNNNHPVQFDDLLESFKKQILYARKSKSVSLYRNRQEWNRLSVTPLQFTKQKYGKDVSPLLTTTWNQPDPYNSQCPVVGGQHCVAGCVAVAMGQVMKYWNYPTQGSGSYSYYDPGSQQNLFANFDTVYDWGNMPNSLIGADSIQINATAKLLYDCGVSVGMYYTANVSGASEYNVPSALQNDFLYDTTLNLIQQGDYTDSVWATIMRTEIDNSRPIFYCGVDTSAGGHAFVLDGYQGTDYFHFNWGWEGGYDGYFYLNNLNPDGYNFDYYEVALIGIKPPDMAVMPDSLIFVWDYRNSLYDTVKTMTIRNGMNVNLNVSNITEGDSWITSINPSSFSLSPDSSKNITIIVTRYGLSIGNIYYSSLSIVSSDSAKNPYIEPVKFIIPKRYNIIRISPVNENFFSGILVGDSTNWTFWICNDGDTSLNVKSISLVHNTAYHISRDSVYLNPFDSADVEVWFKPLPGNSSPDSVKILSNGSNDSLLYVSLYSYEQDELGYDDFTAEDYRTVYTPNKQNNAFAVRFNFVDTFSYHCVTKGKVYVNNSTPLEYIGLFPDTNQSPNINSPYEKISNPFLGSAPGWLTVNFDTTRIIKSAPIWLVAKFIKDSTGPFVGADGTPPINKHSYLTNNMNSWVVNNTYNYMMHIFYEGFSGTEEKNSISGRFTVSYLSNPVRKNLSILYTVPYKMNVSIKLYNITGRLVRVLENRSLEKGRYTKTMSVGTFGEGVYFCRVEAGNYKATKKLILMK